VPTSPWQGARALVTIANNNGSIGSATPQALWLDSHDDLFATEVTWFITAKPGAAGAPDTPQIEMAFATRRPRRSISNFKRRRAGRSS
jgi:hypothetical protein